MSTTEQTVPTIAGVPIVVPPVIGYKGEYILHQAATISSEITDLVNEWGRVESDYQASHPLPFTRDMLELPRFANVVEHFGLTAEMFADEAKAVLLPINTPSDVSKWFFYAGRLGRDRDNFERVERVACLLLCDNAALREAYGEHQHAGVDALVSAKLETLLFEATIAELRAVVGYMVGIVLDHLREAGVISPEAVDSLGEAVGQVLGTAPAPTPAPELSDETAAAA